MQAARGGYWLVNVSLYTKTFTLYITATVPAPAALVSSVFGTGIGLARVYHSIQKHLPFTSQRQCQLQPLWRPLYLGLVLAWQSYITLYKNIYRLHHSDCASSSRSGVHCIWDWYWPGEGISLYTKTFTVYITATVPAPTALASHVFGIGISISLHLVT